MSIEPYLLSLTCRVFLFHSLATLPSVYQVYSGIWFEILYYTDYTSESTDEGAEGFELERKNDEMELNLNSRGNTSFFKVHNF